VFITGALGFLGRALADRLTAGGATVRGVDLVADPGRDVVAGDISRPGPWQAHAAGCELVLHTAAVVSNAVGAAEQWRVNVVGTRRVLDAAKAAGARRFVLFSSVRAFGDTGFPDGVDETWPVRPDGNPYVDTKIAAEQVALQAHAAGEIAVTVVRPADVYGPRSRPWTVLPLWFIRRRRFVLPAQGLGVFSPVYVDDLVAGVLKAATADRAAGQVFTLAAGGVTCAEFFGHYYRMLGRTGPRGTSTRTAVALAEAAGRAERLLGRRTESNAASVRYLARTGTYSAAKAADLLGWVPTVDLADGMGRTEDWLRAEGLL